MGNNKRNKNELPQQLFRFEVLKGISTDEKIEDECELASSKEMLANVEVNQKKLFAGTEQGTGKMKKMY